MEGRAHEVEVEKHPGGARVAVTRLPVPLSPADAPTATSHHEVVDASTRPTAAARAKQAKAMDANDAKMKVGWAVIIDALADLSRAAGPDEAVH